MKKRFQELNIEIARPSHTTVVVQNLSAAQPSDTAETEERRRTPTLASGASGR